MKVLFILSALVLMFVSGCNDQQELTGPWEMWVLVSSPVENEVWNSTEPHGRMIRWAAVPGEKVRCELYRNGEPVMEIFDWQDKSTGEFLFEADLGDVEKGDGFTIVIHDDQGFYGTSGVFEIS